MEQLRKDVAAIDAHVAAFDSRLRLFENQILTAVTAIAAKEGHKGKWDRAWDMASKLAVAAVLGVIGFGASLHERVSYIEHTRFTAADFQKSLREIDQRIESALRGPDWLRDGLKGIETRLEVMRTDVGKMGERMSRLEAKVDK